MYVTNVHIFIFMSNKLGNEFSSIHSESLKSKKSHNLEM